MAHWRDTYRPAQFFFMDARAGIPTLAMLLHVRYWTRPCEKPKRLDCDRISYSFKTALGAHIASQFNFDIEPENIILVAL
jgi:hypothetical protein